MLTSVKSAVEIDGSLGVSVTFLVICCLFMFDRKQTIHLKWAREQNVRSEESGQVLVGPEEVTILDKRHHSMIEFIEN